MQLLSQLVDQFIEYLKVDRKASPLTVRNYTHYLHRFLDFLQDHFPTLALPEALNQSVIKKYSIYLSKLIGRKEKHLSLKTQGYHLIALRSFLRFLAMKGYSTMSVELISVPRGKAKPLKFLDSQQVETLLRLPDNIRDKSIMELLLSTGLRVSSLVKLNRSDVDFDKKEIVISSNTGQKRTIFLSKSTAYWLSKYVKQRKDDSPALFIRKAGRKTGSLRLTARSIQRIIEKYVKRAGLSIKATPHTFRHTFAVNLLSARASLKMVQKLLGHKNISTTQIYTHVTNPQLRQIHKKFHRK